MKRFTLFLAITAITLFDSFLLTAQEANPLDPGQASKPIYLGPTLGYNRTYHSVDLATYNPAALCPIFTNGDNNGFWVGFTYEHLLGKDITTSKSSIIGRVMYNTFPASFSVQSKDANNGGLPSIDPTTNLPISSDVLHTNEVKFSVITIEAVYKFNFLNNLGVTVGPTFDIISLSKTQEQKMSLLKPNNASFKETDDPEILKTIRYTDFISGNKNPRGIILKEGDINGGMRWGIKAGLQYEILTKSNFYIVPSISYNLGIGGISSDQTWRVSAIQIGVDMRFAIK
jgi:hypothetical protein